MILCPYHGPRPCATTDESLCFVCASPAGSVPALVPYIPFAPLIAAPTYPAAAAKIAEPAFSIAPAQFLFATVSTPLLSIDEVLAQIPTQIAALERALVVSGIARIGPLALLYDHPDVSDFEHFRFAAAYPVNHGSPVPPGLEQRHIPSHRVASVGFTGPWSMLALAYPPLRRAILAGGHAFGPLTFERYLVPRGTNAADNVTIIQRQLAEG